MEEKTMLQTKEEFRDWLWDEKEFLRKLREETPVIESDEVIRRRMIELEKQVQSLTADIVEEYSNA